MNHKFNKPTFIKVKKGIIPDVRIVNVLVRNSLNQILLLKRSKDNVYFPGYYHIVTGKLFKGETFLDALYREVEEEIGVKINKESLLKEDEIEYCKWDEKIYEVKRFLIEIPQDSVIKLNHEHSGFVWTDINKIDSFNITPQILECIEAFC